MHKLNQKMHKLNQKMHKLNQKMHKLNQKKHKLNQKKHNSMNKFIVKFIAEYSCYSADSIKHINAIADIIREAIKVFPTFIRELAKTNPELSVEKLRQYEAVAKGKVYPPLLLESSRVYYKIRSFSATDQKQICEHAFEIYVESGNVTARISSMTNMQMRQLFARKHIRTLEEQKAYVEMLKARSNQFYRVGKDHTVFYHTGLLDKEMLLEIAVGMLDVDDVVNLLVKLQSKPGY